jgi:hypothetical protein
MLAEIKYRKSQQHCPIMPDTVDRLEARQIEDRLIDVVMDYDAAHGTFTLCMVWREQEKVYAGVQ